jgi:hypothetical protein
MYHFHHQGLALVFLRSVRRLLVIANVVSSSPILVTLMMMEELHSSETSIITKATWRNIPEDAFFMVTAVKTLNLT